MNDRHFTTDKGTKYITEPQALLVAQTRVEIPPELGSELAALDDTFELGVVDYEQTLRCLEDSDNPPGAEAGATHGSVLVQLAGQLCYLSFDPEARTELIENDKYVDRILSSGHGSVLEHANYSVLFLGIDRACTHELVRHRAGMAYSQVSQRYVGPETLRFVMPFEDQGHPKLAPKFYDHIDRVKAEYAERIEDLAELFPRRDDESKTDHRKRLQSSARSVLSNDVEAGILVTGNARAWRHVFTMRCSKFADVRIRRPFVKALRLLQATGGNLFADFEISSHADGTEVAAAKYPKV